jgi:hypothetical protein
MRQDFMGGTPRRGTGGRARRQVEQPGDLEHHEERAVEPVDAGRHLAPQRIERRRVVLEPFREAQHLADLIDDEAVELAAVIDDDAHAGLPVLGRRQAEPGAQVDRGDDAAAQVERAGDLGRRQRDARQPLRAEHVLHLQDRDPEELAADIHRDELVGDVLGGRLLAAGRDFLAHAASFCVRSVSDRDCSSASRSNFAT